MIQGPEKRVLTIPELAYYLNMKNWATEEALRQGKIRFKWMGKRKVVQPLLQTMCLGVKPHIRTIIAGWHPQRMAPGNLRQL